MVELEGLSEVTHSVVARSCHFLVEQRGEHLGAVQWVLSRGGAEWTGRGDPDLQGRKETPPRCLMLSDAGCSDAHSQRREAEV